MDKRTCPNCGKELLKRQKKYCSKKCYGQQVTKPKRACLLCGKPVNDPHKSAKYCSQYCYKTDSRVRKEINCRCCGKVVEQIGLRERRYCSHDCFAKCRSEDMKGSNHYMWGKKADASRREKQSKAMAELIANGLPRHNNYKSGWYDSKFAGRIYLKSSYEFAFARMLDGIGIEWVYEPKRFEYIAEDGINRNYIPDFYIPEYDLYIEVKGDYFLDKHKVSIVEKQYNLNFILIQAVNLQEFNKKARLFLANMQNLHATA